VFDHGYVRKERCCRDPDDPDPADLTALPDGAARFLVIVCISVLSSRCRQGSGQRFAGRSADPEKLFMSTLQSEIE